MAGIFPAVRKILPSYTIPETIIQYNQKSGYQSLLAGGTPFIRLRPEDRAVYVKYLDIRGQVATDQSAINQLPSVDLVPALKTTPTYLIQTRAEYDHHDIGSAAEWDVPLPEAQRLGMQQITFQKMREYALFGARPEMGEGLLNTPGATRINLTPDQDGNTTVTSYDNGAMVNVLLTSIVNLKSRCMQFGLPVRVSIMGPQRVIGRWEEADIVQLTSYQRPGGGTNTVGGTTGQVALDAGDTITWTYDDTLIGAGANGTDAIIITMPEIRKPDTNDMSTNVFAELEPGLDAVNIQLTDVAAPIEITVPLPRGAVDVTSELKCTSGWSLRPEGITILSCAYS